VGSGVRVTGGLVVYYDFSEGTGEIVHDVGGVGVPLDLVILDRDKARWLPGANGVEFVDAGTAIRSRSGAAKIHDALTASNQFTVEAWIAPSDLDGSDPPRRIVAFSAGTWKHQVNLHLGHDGPDGVFRVRTTCDYYISASTPQVFTGTGRPTHLVASYDGSTMRTVVDGVARETFDGFDGTFGNWDPDYPLVIGNEATLTRSFLGTIMLVAVYDRALSAQEVKTIFQRSGAPIVNAIVALTLRPPQGGWKSIPLPFFAGILLAVIGASLVTLYKPTPGAAAPPTAQGAAQATEALGEPANE
ncbi:MAG: LamG domain-containing protein, partial [Planctomycetes bacterium]|nr:LamG domain-containing protein [Planctomycetota bacterium]